MSGKDLRIVFMGTPEFARTEQFVTVKPAGARVYTEPVLAGTFAPMTHPLMVEPEPTELESATRVALLSPVI